MADVKVIIEGEHRPNDKKQLRVFSTVTLIKSDKNILVDTSSFLENDSLIKGLREEGLAPEDIGIVVLTHLHLDHIINTSLFTNAKVYCKFRKGYCGQFHIVKDGVVERVEIADGVKLAEDVEFLLTPGHTEDMISLVVHTQEGKIVIAGDAFPSKEYLDLNKHPEPIVIASADDFDRSRKKILGIADWIVPGHGAIFKVTREPAR
jgi:glyoxylase-like metal-dependent hydrolase (beta-lactamase superfamily II)